MCTTLFGGPPKTQVAAPTPPPEPPRQLAISPEDSATKRNSLAAKRRKGTASLRIDRNLSGTGGSSGLAIPT